MDKRIDNLKVHDHLCSVYESPAELKSQCVPYLQSGLLLGDQCLYFVDENSPNFVMDAMRENNFPIETYLQSGAFQIVSALDANLLEDHFAEEKMMNYWCDALSAAEQAGFSALRAAVEMTWALSGQPALAPYEATLNKLTEARKLSVICAYHRAKFSAEKLKGLIHAHPLVIRGNQVLDNPSVIPPERSRDGDGELDLQARLDNLEMIRQLSLANLQLSNANAKLKVQEKELSEKNELLEEYAWVVAHDLREPVRIMATYAELVNRDYSKLVDRNGSKMLKIINENADKAIKKIDAILEFNNLDLDRAKRDEVDLRAVVRHVSRALKEQILVENAKVRQVDLPTVYGDERLLEIVFHKLIGNSLKYRGSADPVIEIKTKERVDGTVIVAITDNGIGLGNATSQNVFGMFRRLDEDKPGIGVGLSIARRIVQAHGGRIWFESEQATTTFFMELLAPPKSQRSKRTRPPRQ